MVKYWSQEAANTGGNARAKNDTQAATLPPDPNAAIAAARGARRQAESRPANASWKPSSAAERASCCAARPPRVGAHAQPTVAFSCCATGAVVAVMVAVVSEGRESVKGASAAAELGQRHAAAQQGARAAQRRPPARPAIRPAAATARRAPDAPRGGAARPAGGGRARRRCSRLHPGWAAARGGQLARAGPGVGGRNHALTVCRGGGGAAPRRAESAPPTRRAVVSHSRPSRHAPATAPNLLSLIQGNTPAPPTPPPPPPPPAPPPPRARAAPRACRPAGRRARAARPR